MRHLFDSPLGVNTPLGVPKNIGIGAAALAAGIAATASTASTIYNNYQANLANDEAYERTKELQGLQFQQQKDLYNHQFQKESEYNSPVHLRELYENAGYNPTLLAHNGDIGKAATNPAMPNVPVTSPFGPRQIFPIDLQSGVGGISSALAVGSEIKKNDAESFQKIVSSIPELGKSLGWENARQYAKDMLGMLGVSGSQYERQIEAMIQSLESDSRIKAIQSNLAEKYGDKGAANVIALQEQSFNKVSAEIGLMHSTSKVNDAKIRSLAADYCEKVAHAYNLRKQGDVYSVQAYILDNIKEYNIELQKLSMFRAQRQDATERSLFESLRDVRSYQMNDPEAKEVQLENYKTNNDTFWNEVNVIMSSWQVHTNVGFSGSYGSKDVYGHGFGY